MQDRQRKPPRQLFQVNGILGLRSVRKRQEAFLSLIGVGRLALSLVVGGVRSSGAMTYDTCSPSV